MRDVLLEPPEPLDVLPEVVVVPLAPVVVCAAVELELAAGFVLPEVVVVVVPLAPVVVCAAVELVPVAGFVLPEVVVLPLAPVVVLLPGAELLPVDVVLPLAPVVVWLPAVVLLPVDVSLPLAPVPVWVPGAPARDESAPEADPSRPEPWDRAWSPFPPSSPLALTSWALSSSDSR